MTDRELLEQILSGMTEIKSDVAELKKDVAGLKQDVAVLKQEVAVLKQDVADLKHETADLRIAQRRTETTLENTVNKCIQVLYEAHRMNAERLDRYNIDTIKSNSEIAALMAKLTHDELQSLKSA